MRSKEEIGMKPVGSLPARLYVLSNVHKNNSLVRPVLSMPGSVYYGVAKQVAFWLSHHTVWGMLGKRCNV